ncbi:LOW QUALITY PROTEIN: leucine-rich repeat-containing protein 43-like [Dryobates pubescens]|uniref:LOW QUALITY PROTEIN: leucine-rich repeat-containing protein 43-like n=1 Tax=Dryobates pubescens TaxID=118200 RepID=UPI0023B8988D|nr:LOW QUALITY PROTEIN: leucine-rich repeat-containing protein 43-like [Dryobates pubescens]
MAAPSNCSVSAVFWEHLQHLALQDFPCGLGSWVWSQGGTAWDVVGSWSTGLTLPLPLQNKSRFDAHTSPRRSQPGQEEAMMLDEESSEVLIELLRDPHSPWALPPDCSSQDQYLRETAVLAPELVRGSNIFQLFRTLRIVGKGVSAAAAAYKATHLGQETVSSCCEGKHPGKRTLSPSQGLPRCHYCSCCRATDPPTQLVALIHITSMPHRSTLHVTSATNLLRGTLAKSLSLQVEEVDKGLLQLQKLEQLILSANQINSISSANLPRTLKVLELCCNGVGNLQDLCTQPPPELQHLGLGYNKLRGPSQDKYLTVDFW